MAAVALGDAIGAKLNILPQAGAGGFAITQVSGGHADLAVLGLPEARGQIDAGNVRLLAIQGPSRAPGKYGDAPTMTKSMHIALQDLKLTRLFVVYPGKKSYPLEGPVEVVSIQDLPGKLAALE